MQFKKNFNNKNVAQTSCLQAGSLRYRIFVESFFNPAFSPNWVFVRKVTVHVIPEESFLIRALDLNSKKMPPA